MKNLLESVNSKTNALIELAKLLNTPEMKLDNSVLKMKLSEAITACSELEDENRELKEKIRVLEKDNEEPLIFDNEAYYSQNGDGPFCTACYDKDKKRIRLSKLKIPSGFVNHVCQVCKATYKLNKLK
jgi:hypothetical protein